VARIMTAHDIDRDTAKRACIKINYARDNAKPYLDEFFCNRHNLPVLGFLSSVFICVRLRSVSTNCIYELPKT
jgi:hypothetical protein